MDSFFHLFPPEILMLAMGFALIAGVVKGMVGFAMPTILISGLSTVLDPRLALAGLILPTLITNGIQALRQGRAAAMDSMRRFRRFLVAGAITLLFAAQLAALVPTPVLLVMIGLPVVLFAIAQLSGWEWHLERAPGPRAETLLGGVIGFIGGLSGIWGPPTVVFLTALRTEKREQIRIQGVIFGLGALALTIGHIASGLFNQTTAAFSALLVPAAVLGLWLGSLVQDKIDQDTFRKVTLAVLLIGGANLLRRAIMG